jgi:hypothetical protein
MENNMKAEDVRYYSIQALAWVLGFILVMVFCFFAVTARAATNENAVSDSEKASIVVGMVMGLDMAEALGGRGPLSREQWSSLTSIFSQAIGKCQEIQCVTDRIVGLRESVRKGRSKGMMPIDLEMIR